MGLFGWFNDLFDDFCSAVDSYNHCASSINPASGLPMQDDTMDVAGNIYGTDSHTNWGINPASDLLMMDDSMLDVGGNIFGSDNSHTSSFDDCLSSTSSFDSFGSGLGEL